MHVKFSFFYEPRQSNSEFLIGNHTANSKQYTPKEKQDEETCPTNESTQLNIATLPPILLFSIFCC